MPKQLKPRYELTLYKPRSIDPAETEPLEQLEDAGETFVVTTDPSDARPYLFVPEGRQGAIKLPKRRVETSSISAQVLDRAVSGNATSLDRWATRFFGDAQGRPQLTNLKGRLREWDSEAAAWQEHFTGRVQVHRFRHSKVLLDLELKDLLEDLDTEIFVGAPHASVGYAHPSPLLPNGLVQPYGGFPTVPWLKGTAQEGGGGISVAPEEVDQGRTIVTRAMHDVIFSGETEQIGVLDLGLRAIVIARVRVKITASTADPGRVGEEGDFWLARAFRMPGTGIPGATTAVGITIDGHGRWLINSVAVEPLPSSDPAHMDPPAEGDELEFYLYRYGAPTPDAPLLIDDVHPATLSRDILDGKFGPLVTDPSHGTPGEPLITFPKSAATLDAIEADPSIPKVRMPIPGPEKAREFIEETLLLPHRLGYRIDPENRFELLDWRVTEDSVQGIPTITDSDMVAGKDSASWEHSRDGAITRIEVTHYTDRLIPASELEESDEKFPSIPPVRIKTIRNRRVHLFERYGDLNEKSLEIDARGLRAGVGDVEEGQDSEARIARVLDGIVGDFRSPFGNGESRAKLKLRRTANTKDCREGDLRLIAVSALPDPATNRRGGTRLMRCVERTPEGPHLWLWFSDLGSDAIAQVPSIGAVDQNADDPRNAVDVPVTLNGSGEPVVVEFAVTDTSVAVRPAEDSELWTHGARTRVTGTVVLHGLPAGKRRWLRARTDVSETDEAKLPSAWVFPAAEYVDGQALPAPTNVQATVDGLSIVLTWDVADAELPLMPVIAATPASPADARRAPLPTNATRWVFEDNAPSTEFEVGVKHIDGYGGASPVASVLRTTAAAASQLTAPNRIQVLQARGAGGREFSAREQTTIGFGLWLEVLPTEPDARWRIQISTDPAFGTVEEELYLDPGRRRFPALLLITSTTRHVRALHTKDGYQDSGWSPVVSADPGWLYPEPPSSGDLFPAGYAYLVDNGDGTVDLVGGHGDDPDAERLYYEVSVVPPDPTVYPTVDTTDAFIARASMPDQIQVAAGLDPGDVVLLTARFWSQAAEFGQEVRDRVDVDSGAARAPSAELVPVTETVYRQTFLVRAEPGPGGPDPAEFDYRVDSGTAEGAWAGWAALTETAPGSGVWESPEIVVHRGNRGSLYLRAKVRDSSGRESEIVTDAIPSFRQWISDVEGSRLGSEEAAREALDNYRDILTDSGDGARAAPVLDSAGLQELIDTEGRRLRNAALASEIFAETSGRLVDTIDDEAHDARRHGPAMGSQGPLEVSTHEGETRDDSGNPIVTRPGGFYDREALVQQVTGDGELDGLAYPSGVAVQDREPAEAGADETANNTAADTSAVDGEPAANIHDGSDKARAAINDDKRLQTALEPEAGVAEGGSVHRIYRNREEITVEGPDADGDVAVTFAQSYQAAPLLIFQGGQYISFHNSLNGTQKLRIRPVNVSASGFTSRTKILNPGATTAESDDFPSGNLLNAQGETTAANLDPGGANDDNYTVHYYVEITADEANSGTLNSAEIVVAIETNDGGGWVERATFNYSVTSDDLGPQTKTWDHEQKLITVTGIGLNDDIRLRVKSFTVDQTGSFKVRGGDAGGTNPETYNGVTYTTASESDESAIPDAGDSALWVAQEVT